MNRARRKKFQKEDGYRKYFVQAANGRQKVTNRKKDRGQTKRGWQQKIFHPSRRRMSEGTNRKTDRGQIKFEMEGARRKKFQKEDGSRKYFVRPPTDVRRDRQKNRQRADEISNRGQKFQMYEGP